MTTMAVESEGIRCQARPAAARRGFRDDPLCASTANTLVAFHGRSIPVCKMHAKAFARWGVGAEGNAELYWAWGAGEQERVEQHLAALGRVAASPRIEIELRLKEPEGFTAIIRLLGEHDLTTSPELARTLAAAHGDTLVDLSACAFLDSSVIAVLLARAGELLRVGHRFEIVALPENVMVARTLEVVQLDRVVVVHAAYPRSADA